TALTPDAAGKITVTISNAQTYNYLNGFTLTESVSDLNGSSGPLPAFANHTISATSGTVNYGNGFPFSNLRPGDTINVLAGTYTTLIFGNFKGDPSLPIIIRNKGGQVKVGEIRILNDAKYFKLLGNGHSATQYGFKVYRTQYTGITVSKATDFEIGYCEVSGMTSGFFIKNNPVSTDPLTIYPNYVFKNIYLHHNYIHDVKNEAMYIGHTDPDGGQGGNMLIPVRMENVEIAYNVVNNTGWDGIQLANARTGNKVHHNTVTNFGTLNVSGQQAAIQIGSNSNVSIYDNTIKNGTGNGIQVFGYGYIEIYNNVLENCAKDGSLRGRETIYCNPYLTGPEVNPKQQVKIYNNTIRYPQPFGAIKVGGISTNSLPSTIINNKLLIPNAPSNWHSIHVVSVVPSSVISGNTLITQ
ncbi:MAG TPA: right-handed parallel beta-helix repeat-containing protein, partial [Flavisolibacter sp.]